MRIVCYIIAAVGHWISLFNLNITYQCEINFLYYSHKIRMFGPETIEMYDEHQDKQILHELIGKINEQQVYICINLYGIYI